jgi:hypothetical protein
MAGAADAHKAALVRLELVFQSYPGTAGADAERAVAKAPFELTVKGVVTKGETSAQGVVVAYLPAGATGRLKIFDTEYELRPLGKIEALATRSGTQRRLQLLGYELGEVDGVLGGKTGRAALQFQADNAPLDTDGVIGAQTRAQLKVQVGE